MLRLLLLLAAGLAVDLPEVSDYCPPACACSAVDSVDMSCQLPRANITVRGTLGSSIKITCDDDTTRGNFTCDELPAMAFGQNQSIRLELDLSGCELVPPACVARRLGARGVAHLYLWHVTRGDRLNAELLQGLEGLERLAVYGDSISPPNMTIPTEALSHLPSLTSLIFNGVRLTLRPDDFTVTPNLTYLEVVAAGLTSLPEGVFRPLQRLERLNLWMNRIDDIEGVFDGLVSLQRLDLSANRVRAVTPLSAARVPPPLRALSLAANAVATLTPLANLTHLEQLEILRNSVPLTISPGALSGLQHLASVNLSWSGVSSLPPDTLAHSPALRSLNLAHNKLQLLPGELFLSQAMMEHLDLSYNMLQELTRDTFTPLRNLRSLNLDNNQLVMFAPRMFSTLSELRVLRACHNSLTQRACAELADLTRLRELVLAYNQIASPEDGEQQYSLLELTFSRLSSLQVLDLSHNQLRAAPPNYSAALLRLDLSYNNITELTYGDVELYSNQAEVDVRHNQLATVLLLPGAPPANQQPAGPRSALLLDHNPFHCDCKLYNFITRLHGYTPLSTTEAQLEVGSARCASPPSLAQRPLRALRLRELVCHMRGADCAPACSCLLRQYTRTYELTCPVPPESYPNLTDFSGFSLELTLMEPPPDLQLPASVRALNLSGLALDKLPPGVLAAPPPRLDLSRNLLPRVPLELLRANVTLRLAGNPLLCDCWHSEDVEALQVHERIIEDFENVTCKGGAHVRGLSVPQLCSTWRAGALGGALAAAGLLLAVGALLLLRYSTHVRVWLYARGCCARCLVAPDEERPYDLFLSFCHEDERFVADTLLPALEAAPHRYKVCIHYRDWIPGEWIPAQIAQSVADSRRTVIVVSRAFLDSLWGRAEFRTANMSAVRERRARVIVVLLEDISSHKQLDPELKAYLATNTYLKWGDPWFWDKFRYALPPRQQEDQTKSSKTQHKQSNEMFTRPPSKSANKSANKSAIKSANKSSNKALDTRLTSQGVIINAAALAAPAHKRAQYIHLDIATINKAKMLDAELPA